MPTKSIFISHRRDNGQATTDAILIKNLLTEGTTSHIFMDVTEDYLGLFPKTLKEEIQRSNTFILVLPKADSYEYLCDPENWVHKEIHYALTYKETLNRPSRIVPVAFDKDFKFPSRENLGDIADIADYSITFFDTNNPDSSKKLIRASGASRALTHKTKVFISLLIIAACTLLGFWGLRYINNDKEQDNVPVKVSEYKYEASIQFVDALNRFDSIQLFTDSCGQYVESYLAWYLSELDNGVDPTINAEFNKVYVKEYVVKLIVLAYLAYATDLDKPVDQTFASELMDKCYESIPNEARYPMSIKQLSKEDRNVMFGVILDKTIEVLNTDPRLRSIDEENIRSIGQIAGWDATQPLMNTSDSGDSKLSAAKSRFKSSL